MEQSVKMYDIGVWSHDTLWTWANLVTAIRTIGGLCIFLIASIMQNTVLNFIGLSTYWALDMLDGYLARALKQETRLGAQMDILSDRILIAFFYFNYLTWHPHLILPVLLFLFEFLCLDHYLSNQFLRYPLLSPNYFHKVDQIIWLLNWSKPAKLLNSGLVTIVIVSTQSFFAVLIIVVGLIIVKSYSCVRLHQLPLSNRPHGPAAARTGAS